MSVKTQLNRESKWAVYLTLFYLVGWIAFAYFSPTGRGWLGFPLWFELSCIYLPILLLVVISLVIKLVYKDIDLEGNRDEL